MRWLSIPLGSLTACLFATACSVVAGGGGDRPWECSVLDSPDFCQEVAATGETLRCVIAAGETVGICADCGTSDVCGNGVDDDCDGTIDNGSPETCNDIDDDCDGMVDEDLDEDGDGYSWCPTARPPLDCDDSNASVRPTREGEVALPDVCDGLDNDCDPSTTDGAECSAMQDCDAVNRACVDFNCTTRPSLCAGDEFCDENATPPTCQPRDMTCFNPAFQCDEGLVCNPATAECVSPQPNGTTCDYDAECASALCLPIQALRVLPAHVADRNGVCGRSCCSDSECSAGERCWASGSGARGCVPESLLAPGAGPPAASVCAARRECSGECQLVQGDAYEVPSRISLSCGPGYTSRVSCSTGPLSVPCWLLGVPGATCIDGTCQRASCIRLSDCPTGMCAGGECREACATSEDCGGGGACVHVVIRSEAASREDYMPACSYNSLGTGVRGASCTSDGECLDRTCVDETGTPMPVAGAPTFCADTCCADSSCQMAEQCRPIFVRGHWENHCLPKPTFGRVGVR